MLSYRLSRLFYDLHTDRALAGEYRSNRPPVIARYDLPEPVIDALHRDDVAFLAKLTNGFLLRYYFFVIGMAEADFIAGLQVNREVRRG